MSDIKFKPAELRTMTVAEEERKKIKKNPVYIICDNILDTYNVGAIFRLADAVSAEKVLLCGVTETPPNTRIKKASINTTEWVTWEYASTTVEAISNLKSQIPNIKIIAIEQDEMSIPYTEADYSFPLALMVSNETTGAAKDVLELVDQIVELPMWGVNVSLNVMVSLGIVLYEVMGHKKV